MCVVSSRACGLRQQIRSGIDGIQIQDSEDSDEIARRLDEILYDVRKHDYMARNGQQRVHDEFLVYQAAVWLVEAAVGLRYSASPQRGSGPDGR